jgi:cytochrome c oxidase subunit 2
MESVGQMILGETARKSLHFLALIAAALMLAAAPQGAFAQDEMAQDGVETDAAATAAEEGPAFEHFGPEMIKGQPVNGNLSFQPQYTDTGEYALWFHDAILLPVITIISLFVLALLLWVIVRYNKRRNTTPSRTSHNTLIEVIWTLVPVLILVVIAVPSITLIARQYASPPEDALTVKATGYQWYWGYTYPDNGGFEVISNMMDETEALDAGLPPQLAADNRMVVPVGEKIRIQTTGADVIHSFGIPSLWFKLDAVPGRINEHLIEIKEPGIYYGQCMELCGARHAYMPIAIEARSREDFERWVLTQPGGTLGDAEEDAPEPTDAELVSQPPASAEEGAPAEGEAPTQDTAPTEPGALEVAE